MSSYYLFFYLGSVVGYAVFAFIPLFVKVKNPIVYKLLRILWVILSVAVIGSTLGLILALLSQ